VIYCRRDGLAKSTITTYLNLLTRMTSRLHDVGFNKNIDEIDQEVFDELLMYLEDVKGISRGEIRNYKKVLKKLYRWRFDEDMPKWVNAFKLGTIESPVQPSDLLTQNEVDKILSACRHPRNKAFIAVMLDSGMRVGALGSTRIKNVEFNQYGDHLHKQDQQVKEDRNTKRDSNNLEHGIFESVALSSSPPGRSRGATVDHTKRTI